MGTERTYWELWEPQGLIGNYGDHEDLLGIIGTTKTYWELWEPRGLIENYQEIWELSGTSRNWQELLGVTGIIGVAGIMGLNGALINTGYYFTRAYIQVMNSVNAFQWTKANF